MLKFTRLLVLLMLAVLVLASGCVKKTMTDQELVTLVQKYLDTPADPSDPTLLTPEERSAVVSFEIYKNIVKVKLVEGTVDTMWTPIGTKMVKIFAKVNRDKNILNDSYYSELYIPGMYKDKKNDNLFIGSIRLQNSSDRTFSEIGAPRPKQL